MLIKRISIFSGIEREMDLDITEEHIKLHKEGLPIQKAMPHLSKDQREFYLTGMTPEEWDEMVAEDEDDENGDLDDVF